jgi:primary-amine oxidase
MKLVCMSYGTMVASIVLLAMDHPAASAPTSRHPLDPLTKQEILMTAQILRISGKINEESRVPIITLQEPPKSEVLGFTPGSPMRREAFVIVYERSRNKTYEAVVDLNGKRLISWSHIPGVQPPLMEEDFVLVNNIVRADPRWQEAMRKRGITNYGQVEIDPWPAGEHGVARENGMRLVTGVSYYKGQRANPYARPIEGVLAYVNLNTKSVFKFVDAGIVPLTSQNAELDEGSVGKLRRPPKPLQISQPQGTTFEIHGHEITWQNWRFRFALHHREGLVLYTVGYEDHGKLRPILYRGSLSELFVPYGDPGDDWAFRTVFDMGEEGLGWPANSLEPGTQCPTNASFASAVFANERGVIREIPRAVAIYERDGGPLWTHNDWQKIEARRARELVLSFFATAGNYDYGLNWIFHQDGCLEAEVVLTGIMTCKGVASELVSRTDHQKLGHGHLVAPNLEAVHHQHFFNFRLDMDVEGPDGNCVVEMNTQAARSKPEFNQRTAIIVTESLLRTEQDAQRQIDMAANRKWKVINPSVKNTLGQPVGYALLPGENSVPYVAQDSPAAKRAGFINHHLWVTRYDPRQMNAAGRYVVLSKGDDGLPAWVKANRSIENEDVVLWYTMGITHIPRPEEWPVMSAHRAGFKLVPCGFFSRNPALDVPKQRGSKQSSKGSPG